jgi:lipopolysaccharide transport system ATP-binding protein
MSSAVIRVENLSKRYELGARERRYQTLRETMVELAAAPFRRLWRLSGWSGEAYHLWALKDINLEVRQGEALGIIGRNGAGKSTLLKVLSRITEPTSGRALVWGRIGSLLEVGTGFHSELTGRENIYLNGAILGMSRAEIRGKFDEIVAFAEVEKFLDTPVKHYSSGMHVRLAFAVAAHLEPEILLVDEVLAVGDAVFQKKCLGKMGTVVKSGRTILFVSHNMSAMQNLCSKVVWMANGQIQEQGDATEVVSHYLSSTALACTERLWNDPQTAPGNHRVRLHRVCVRPENGQPTEHITMRTPLVLEFEFWNLVNGAQLNVNFQLLTEDGTVAFGSAPTQEPHWFGRPHPVGLFRSTCRIPGDLLRPGVHFVRLRIVRNAAAAIYQHEDSLSFEVQDVPELRGGWFGSFAGAVRPLLEWQTDFLENRSVPAEFAIEPTLETF